MTPLLFAVTSAFWLGVLTSISPCPLATNLAAISYVGRNAGSPGQVILSGLLYTLGRVLVYVVLGGPAGGQRPVVGAGCRCGCRPTSASFSVRC